MGGQHDPEFPFISRGWGQYPGMGGQYVPQYTMTEYKRLTKANLIVIDDVMLFPVEKKEAISLFNFINHTYENTSFIITTNKMPAEWDKLLDDEVLATALLDRLLYKCEIINLAGKSYRMKNRKTIFESESN